MTKLVSEHQKNKNSYAGVHASKGWTQDLLAEGVLETYLMKKQAYLSAVECSVTLLRIDDIIAARKIEQREKFDLIEILSPRWWKIFELLFCHLWLYKNTIYL